MGGNDDVKLYLGQRLKQPEAPIIGKGSLAETLESIDRLVHSKATLRIVE
jgi:hypothetical protein